MFSPGSLVRGLGTGYGRPLAGAAGGEARGARCYTARVDRAGSAGRSPGEVALRGARLAHHIVDVLADRQASDVVLLDLTSLSAFTDYFVIATVDNVRQMRAIIDTLAEEVDRVAPDVSGREEGTVDSGWVLFDLGDVVVHLLSLERRAYYDLEELWSTAREVVRIQ